MFRHVFRFEEAYKKAIVPLRLESYRRQDSGFASGDSREIFEGITKDFQSAENGLTDLFK